MAQMIVIYKTPKDAAAFDKHYFEIHVPLAMQLPGLRKYEVSHGPVHALAGAPETYLVAILHFDDLAAIKNAFESPIGVECRADRMIFAPDDADVLMFLLETREV